jgi:hypothetical protein
VLATHFLFLPPTSLTLEVSPSTASHSAFNPNSKDP